MGRPERALSRSGHRCTPCFFERGYVTGYSILAHPEYGATAQLGSERREEEREEEENFYLPSKTHEEEEGFFLRERGSDLQCCDVHRAEMWASHQKTSRQAHSDCKLKPPSLSALIHTCLIVNQWLSHPDYRRWRHHAPIQMPLPHTYFPPYMPV